MKYSRKTLFFINKYILNFYLLSFLYMPIMATYYLTLEQYPWFIKLHSEVQHNYSFYRTFISLWTLSNRFPTCCFDFSTELSQTLCLKNFVLHNGCKQKKKMKLCACIVRQGIKLADFPLKGSPNQKTCWTSENKGFEVRRI